MKTLKIIAILLFAGNLFAQNAFTIKPMVGIYDNKKYNSSDGAFVGISFDKQIKNNYTIALSTNVGWFRYFTPAVNSYPDIQNSHAEHIHNSLILKKDIIKSDDNSLKLAWVLAF
jgi:hypothetical protein